MQKIYDAVVRHFVGRRDEALVMLAALQSGRNVFLEGPPGSSKSTILKAVVEEMGRPFYWVTGNSDLTATKLLGYFDPAMVMSEGYKPEHFEYGALTRAMEDGGILYIEEFNRLPDDTVNVFITAMSERAIPVPRLGTIQAKPEFCVVASLNPQDDVGTLRISRALRDRFCSIWMDYQHRDEEIEIVNRQIPAEDVPEWIDVDALVDVGVEMCRRTRSHEDIRLGASVRGAIDMTLIACRLLNGYPGEGHEQERTRFIQMAARTALRDKIHLNEVSQRTPDDVLDEIWEGLAGEWRTDDGAFWEVGSPERLKKNAARSLTS